MTSLIGKKYDYKIVLIIALINSPLMKNLGDFGGIIAIFLLSCMIPSCKSKPIIEKTDLKTLCSIFILCATQSIIFYLFGKMELPYLSRGISSSLFRIIELFFIYKFINYYRHKSIDYLTDGLFLAYSINIVNAIILFGPLSVLKASLAIFTGGFGEAGAITDKALEVSDAILLIMPLVSVFYLFLFTKKKKRSFLIRSFFAIFIALLAYKRIAIAAGMLALLLLLIQPFYNKRAIKLLGVFAVSLCLCYIYFIKSKLIYLYASLYDVNLMSRDRIWTAIDDRYQFAWNYWGEGWGYISKYLHLYKNTTLDLAVGGIHNDILKFYIDLGFFGFIVYSSFFLIYIPLFLWRKFNPRLSFCFWIGQSYLFFLYLTDNSSIYTSNQFVAYIFPFSIYIITQNNKSPK